MMNQQRRMLLGGGAMAALAIPPAAGGTAAVAPKLPLGKPGDFNFLEGSWKIANRRRKSNGQIDVFEGESTCHTILGGAGSVEDLRIPARDFAGMGLRLLDREKQVWVDHWVNAKGGVMTLPGTEGGFVDGAGVFMGEHSEGGRTVIVRGVWDQITPTSCHWTQNVSRDGGTTWTEDWAMVWTRVGA
jgi:hypothetical protein